MQLVVLMGVAPVCFFTSATSFEHSISFPEHFKCEDATCTADRLDSSSEDSIQFAMLQKNVKSHKKIEDTEQATQNDADQQVFRWGINADSDHPPTIGKAQPHPIIQNYEARVPYLTGMVLNIFVAESDGDGGLLLALQVPSPCLANAWVEVDRSRCSSKYPCTLRLPAGAVRGSETTPTIFRSVVIAEDEDYQTSFLKYKRVTLDHDGEVVVAHNKLGEDKSLAKRFVKFSLNPVLAAGSLSVTPVVEGAGPNTVVHMKLRQPDPVSLQQVDGQVNNVDSHLDLVALQNQLQSYRQPWASQWREAASGTGGCDLAPFEVVADQLYPGEVELEVWTADGSGRISDVLVTTRVSWAGAETILLEYILKDHFAYFLDPDVIVHGLPVGALKKGDFTTLSHLSNPTEWGYAMQSWVIMAETGVLKPVEVVAKLQETFNTLITLQQDQDQFALGMFFPYYSLRKYFDANGNRDANGEKTFPQRSQYKELPCGDDALFYSSLLMVQGWLIANGFNNEAQTAAQIAGRMDFSKCVHKTDCNAATNGLEAQGAGQGGGDSFWSVPLTVNADTQEANSFNWNVWADEGGLVAMIVALTGAVTSEQYASIVHQQQRYSPCARWEGITVGHAAFFNSVFTLPTRSMLGFGTLFSSAYYHEFALRSVLPTFRAYQKLKKKLGMNYMGPSDAMTMRPKKHQDKVFGSYAYWPPNNMYDCRLGKVLLENQCTWCKGIQYEGLEDNVDTVVPHGSMASFLVSSVMERSQFSRWLEDTKLLMTDASGVYKPGYGLEVVAPAKRTPRGGVFDGAFDGRGIWESLSHGYTILSMYEGLATISRRYELLKQAGVNVPGTYVPPKYRPLSDFVNFVPEVRSKIDSLLAVARDHESQEKQCAPSDFGPAHKY